jgi:hypothetical protein
MVRKIELDDFDESNAESVRKQIDEVIAKSHNPVAVAKRIAQRATYHRNKGREAAIKRYPFKDTCEASGLPIDRSIASLDELEPEKGYAGKLRWVCQKANGDGKGSCGKC